MSQPAATETTQTTQVPVTGLTRPPVVSPVAGPPQPAATRAEREAAYDLVGGRPLVLLTGAGLSTDSGIPDYRGPGSPDRAPMTYQEFVATPGAQQRYWARSHIGWGRMHAASPNPGHRASAALDPSLLITQNVDGLHEEAGSRRMVALHGRIAEVVCLDCRTISGRGHLHDRLEDANPGYAAAHTEAAMRPDGDVEIDDGSWRAFVVPECEVCGGVLKPDVVFFGENVPAPRVERCYTAVDRLAETDGVLLVVGSSLTVMSGFRFVRRAVKAGTPVVIVNRGGTRGDELATTKLVDGCSEFLAGLAQRRTSTD